MVLPLHPVSLLLSLSVFTPHHVALAFSLGDPAFNGSGISYPVMTAVFLILMVRDNKKNPTGVACHRLSQRQERIHTDGLRPHSRHGSRGGMQDLKNNMGNLQTRTADSPNLMAGLDIGGPRGPLDISRNITDSSRKRYCRDFVACLSTASNKRPSHSG